ncbi:hypothetical protein ACJZ2D_005249 [Fusarium nematophilum]
MVNKCTIKIENRSGSLRSYALSNKAPEVEGSVQGKVWSNVFALASVPNGSSGTFTIFKEYYTMVGSSQGEPGDQVQASVVGKRAVTLSSRRAGGPVELPNSAKDDAFEIQTGAFDAEQAKKGKYLIGYGISNGSEIQGPLATFCPQPNDSYHITPVNTYYVAPARINVGTMIGDGLADTAAKVDFITLPDDVTLVHDKFDTLTIQAP